MSLPIYTLRQAGYICLLILCVGHILPAQTDISIGSWRTHFSYQQGNLVCVADDRVYCASQNGLFFYDSPSSSLNILSKLDGLSDAGIVAMDYQEEGDLLVLAYRSKLIDVLSEGRLTSFSLLQSTDQDEQIYDVYVRENTIYLASSLGVRVLDVSTDGRNVTIAIRESYTRLSSEGETLPIYDISILEDSIFLATEEGIIANDLDMNTNRQDYASWRRIGEEEGITIGAIHHIANDGENILAAVDGRGVFRWVNGSWEITEIQVNETFSSLNISDNKLLAVANAHIYVLDESLRIINTADPSKAAVDKGGNIWVADAQSGLIRISEEGREVLTPSGPLSDDIHSLHFAHDKIFALLDSSAAGFSVFEAGRWNSYSPELLSEELSQTSIARLLDVAYLSGENVYYLASLGSGLIKWDGAESFEIISRNATNNSLSNNKVSSVSVWNNHLWLTTYDAINSLHTYDDETGAWQSYAPSVGYGQFPVKLELLQSDKLWFISNSQEAASGSGNSLSVYDASENNSQNIRTLVPNADMPGSELTDLVLDREGQVWLTGNEGVTFFPAPLDIVDYPTATKPIFENQYLLYGEYLTSIAVDGGNRKWIGSRDGAWLFNETGEELIHHFTSANSPLPSDDVYDISIDDASGEVFFLTDQGMVSYRGSATVGPEVQPQQVKVFPNPIPADFEGQVGIEGLVNDANVKITTISGTLVRELEANGGTAVWDIRDYHGSRVGTGIYLIFSASADGSQTFIAKVAVIN